MILYEFQLKENILTTMGTVILLCTNKECYNNAKLSNSSYQMFLHSVLWKVNEYYHTGRTKKDKQSSSSYVLCVVQIYYLRGYKHNLFKVVLNFPQQRAGYPLVNLDMYLVYVYVCTLAM